MSQYTQYGALKGGRQEYKNNQTEETSNRPEPLPDLNSDRTHWSQFLLMASTTAKRLNQRL
jgi:hypothetical protein